MGSSSRPRLEIQFDEKKPAYRSGRELTGAVIVDCHGGPVHVTRFAVECLGFSEVQESAHSGQKRLRRDHLLLKQTLLQPHQTLLESRRLEFRFRLPSGLPHSIECDDVGFVRYCCRAVASLEAAATDTVEAVGYFSLIEEVDLNSPAVQQACRPGDQASASAVQRIGGRSGKDEVKASLVLAKSAYVPGENVECTLSVHCGASCGAPVDRATIRLVQVVASVGENGARHPGGASGRSSQTIIVQEQVQADEQYSEHYWSARCQLHIPGAVASSQPPSDGKQRAPLRVKYTIEMLASLAYGSSSAASAAKDLSVACPVVIGTVPLQDATNKLHPAAIEPAIVDVSRCVISEAELGGAKERHATRSNSLLGQLIPSRRRSSYRAAPPIQYTLYCIYYPTISLIRRPKGLKSILKRHSVGNSLDTAGGQGADSDDDELQVTKRTASISWYETPL